LDWVYIDALHAVDAVRQDLRAWYQKVKAGGLMSGHDYLDGKYPIGNFGVKTAVNEFVREIGVRELFVSCEPHPWKSWYFQKPG
jgi:hypothetical protein